MKVELRRIAAGHIRFPAAALGRRVTLTIHRKHVDVMNGSIKEGAGDYNSSYSVSFQNVSAGLQRRRCSQLWFVMIERLHGRQTSVFSQIELRGRNVRS